jgi:HNH endonuclease
MPKGVYPRKPPKSIEDHFWSKVIVRGYGCWGWCGSLHSDGYGLIGIKRRAEGYRKNFYAHRVSWKMFRGPIPKGLFVLHKCDNPPCTNPKHLFLGTNKDNMIDCSRKGRQNGKAKSNPGMKNGMAKLTDDIVRDVLYSNEPNFMCAKRLGLSRGTVSAIRKRKVWKHVS